MKTLGNGKVFTDSWIKEFSLIGQHSSHAHPNEGRRSGRGDIWLLALSNEREAVN